MTQPLLIIAAGGTGGHMFPAQALAETMLAKGWRVRLTTDARGARYTGGFPHSTEIVELPSATFARGGPLAKLMVLPRILLGIVRAAVQMRRDRPAVVVGFGGYPSIPALGAAWVLRLPRMIHEQNGVPGRVNEVFARRVALVACGIWPTRLPAGTVAEHVGNPVRGAVRAQAGAPYSPPGTGPLRLLAIGGSQGARILSDHVPGAIAALPEDLRSRIEIAQQARPEDVERVTDAYAEMGVAAEIQPFFRDVPQRMAAAHLVISRAGASTLADLTVIGRPSILIPFAAAAGDHQSANARGLVDAGGAILIPEKRLDADSLAAQIAAVLSNPDGAAQMAQAALDAGKPEATEALVALVEKLAGKAGET